MNLGHHTYPDELGECVVDVGAAWHEETTAGAEIVEEEQLLILRSRQRRLFNDFTYPYYLQVQPARSSSIHSRELSNHHTADQLSATDREKKKKRDRQVCGAPAAGKQDKLFPCKTVKTHLIHSTFKN